MTLTKTILPALVAGALLAACAQRNPEDSALSAPPPPPAAVVAGLDSVPLDAKLARMQVLLDESLEDGPAGSGRNNLIAVELISDRLLEAPPPFAWTRDGYSTDARLRQLQSLADRIIAELRREDPDHAPLVADVHTLRSEIAAIRSELALGGGPAPPPMDSLLAQIPIEHGATASDLVTE